MSNWAMFRRSLSDHPGHRVGVAWVAALILSFALRKEPSFFAEISAAGWTGMALLCLLPWIPILITAWQFRHQYSTNESST